MWLLSSMVLASPILQEGELRLYQLRIGYAHLLPVEERGCQRESVEFLLDFSSGISEQFQKRHSIHFELLV